MKTFEKTLHKLQTGSIFFEWNFYPYSLEYVGEDEDGDGSVFFVQFLDWKQEYLEEDLNEFFDIVVYEFINIYLKKRQEKLQSIAVRFFERDIEALKKYAEQNACSYQVLMRNAIHKYTQEIIKQ